MIAARRLGPLLVLALLAATAGGQYVEESLYIDAFDLAGFAYNRDADVVYGVGSYDSTVFAIDCVTNTVVMLDRGVPFPAGFIYDTLDHKSYCPFFYSVGRDSLLVIDGQTHRRLRSVHVDFVSSCLWAADDDRLYMSLWDQDSIQVMDCRTDSVVARIGVAGRAPYTLWLSLRHRKLYAADAEEGVVSAVDRTSGVVVSTLQTGITRYRCGVYSEAHDRLVFDGGGLTGVDGASDTVVWFVDPPGAEVAVCELPELGRVLVACDVAGSPDTVFGVDLATGAVVTRVVSGSRPVALARSPATGLVYCANGGTADVAVISSDGVRVLATLPVCGSGFTFAPRLRRAYLPRSWGWVYVLRDTLGVPCVSERGRVPRLRSLAASQNPFRKRVDLALPRTVSDSRLDVYSADGTFVRGLPILAGGGFSRCTWDGDDSRGREVPAGIYTIVLRQGTSCCARVRLTKLH